jgi:hypothetical protein
MGSKAPSLPRKTGGQHPGFPVRLGGVTDLHAAFLNESRSRGRRLEQRTGNPGISLVFREMWDTANLNVRDGCPTFAKAYVGRIRRGDPDFLYPALDTSACAAFLKKAA